MMEGTGTHSFEGTDFTQRINAIDDQATVIGFSIDDIAKLGIVKNAIDKGCLNADGSYVFTNIKSLRKNKSTTFSMDVNGNHYTARCKGFAAIKLDTNGNLEKQDTTHKLEASP